MVLQCHENEIVRNLIKKQDNEKINYLSEIENFNFEFIEDFYNLYENNVSFLLFYACFYNYPKFAQLLITNRHIDLDSFSNEHKLNVEEDFGYPYNQEGKSDKCKIIDDVVKSKNEIINFLIKTQKNIEFSGTFLVELMQCENYELLKIMLSQPNINVFEISFTLILMYLDHLSLLFLAIVKLLLNHPNIDVNKSFEPNTSRTTYRTALHIAIETGYTEVVKLLLEKPDIDVNSIANFDEESFNFEYWRKGKQFDSYYTPLQEAVELEDIEVIKLLLAHPRIDVNKYGIFDTYEGKYKYKFNRVKQTVLCRAIQMQNFEIVQLLLQHQGIDVNRKAVFYQNETNDNYNNEDDTDEEEMNTNEDVQELSHFIKDDDDDSKLIIRRRPLQFAYAGKSKEIIQLLLKRNDIISTYTKRKDVLIGIFTKDIGYKFYEIIYNEEEEEMEEMEYNEEEEI